MIDGLDSLEGIVKQLSLYKDLLKSVKVEDQECPTTIWRGRQGAWFLKCEVSSVRDFQMETVMEESWDLIKQPPNPPTRSESSCFPNYVSPGTPSFLLCLQWPCWNSLLKYTSIVGRKLEHTALKSWTTYNAKSSGSEDKLCILAVQLPRGTTMVKFCILANPLEGCPEHNSLCKDPQVQIRRRNTAYISEIIKLSKTQRSSENKEILRTF